jgi:hypothetical protein
MIAADVRPLATGVLSSGNVGVSKMGCYGALSRKTNVAQQSSKKQVKVDFFEEKVTPCDAV